MKILCILYDDPKGGMPKSYPVKELPKLEKYPDGMMLPTPKLTLSHSTSLDKENPRPPGGVYMRVSLIYELNLLLLNLHKLSATF